MTGRPFGTSAARTAVAFALAATFGLSAFEAAAQCQVTQQLTKFDPPPEGVSPADMFTRSDSLALGGEGASKKLLVRYSYGFVVYGLANPGYPAKLQVRSLKTHDGYPKNGDGLERTNDLATSSDAMRVVVPWTDTTKYGTVALANWPTGYSGGGDYAPPGTNIRRTAVARVGSRYLGFSLMGSGAGTYLFVADITTLAPNVGASPQTLNSIPSETVPGSFGSIGTSLQVVEGTRTYVVVSALDKVTVLDVTGAGAAVPNISAGFTSWSYTLSDLGISSGQIVLAAAALHPVNGDLYLLHTPSSAPPSTQGSSGTRLNRINVATGQATLVGTYHDPSGTTGVQPGPKLLPFDSDLAAVFLEANHAVGGQGLGVHVRSASDFSRNLAAGLRLAGLDSQLAMAAFKSGGTIHVYSGQGVQGTYAAALNCAVAPSPATASMTVERVLASGAVEAVADGGAAYLGDELRIKPAFSPPDSIQPVTDWRLDYDFHDALPNSGPDSSATPMRVSNPDASGTTQNLPASQYVLLGPCDPKGAAGGGGTPSSGAGCWDSVTSNGAFTLNGQPDFPLAPTPGSTKDLTLAFEARNALNEGTSGLATHRIRWTVPTAVLRSTSLLAGGEVSVEPQGTPQATGYKWYFSGTRVGQVGDAELSLRPLCTGATCNPGLNQPGEYRYWVSVPYRNGFRTPDCPELNGELCSGDAAKTVSVTDVVLGFTVPTGGIVGAGTLTIASQSVKAGVVSPCPATGTGFSYDLCAASGGSCPVGDYSVAGLLAPNPFPSTGSGTLTIPMPPEGSWGVRLRYTYTTTGDCGQTSAAYWPAAGAAQEWAPVTVTKARPTIKLRNSTDTADLTFNQLFDSYQTTTGTTFRAFAEVNGVRDASPPPTMQWTYVKKSGGNPVSFGSTQGASVSIATADDYQVVLTGYGIDAAVNLLVSEPAGGGGGGGGGGSALYVSSLQVSNALPPPGEIVSFTCSASGGYPPYSYAITFGDGQSYSGSNYYTTHAYANAGTFTARCTVTDGVASTASAQVGIRVGTPPTGNCDIRLSGTGGVIMPYQGEFYVTSGQQLTMEALNTTESASWQFGDGSFGSGTPVTHAYVNASQAEVSHTLTLTAGSCSKSYKIYVAPSAGPDFTVADAGTNVALEWVSDAFKASAGQVLKFTSTGTTGAVSWDFGDGTTSTEASPTKAYAPPVDTTYTVRLTNGDKSKQANIKVAGTTGAPLTGNYIFPSYADGSTLVRTAVDPNKPIRFTGLDQATTYTWDFGDGTALGSGSPVLHTFTRGGTFTVKLTVARDGVPGTKQTPNPTTFIVKPPPDPLLWVAGGMAYTDNGAGVKWQSDLTIFNPGTQTATISLGFVSGATWDGATKVDWRPLALVAGETKSYANVLKSLFRLDQGAWGVVLVRGDDIPVAPVIVSRTYNAATADTTGTYGLSVPALSVAAGVQPQSAAGGNFLAGLRHDASFRTNLTVANLKEEAAEVEVVFRGADGAALGTPAKIAVEGRGVKQLNAALAAPVSEGGAGWTSPTPHFSAEVRIKKGSGVYPYATVIDSETGDAIVVTPAARPSVRYRLPGILRYGTWLSDVSLLNPTANERRVRLEYSYVKKGESDRTTKAKTITLKAFETKVWTDFFGSILELPPGDTSEYSESFIDLTTPSDDAHKDDPFVVAGKTYAASGDGTIGLQVDPYVFEDGIGAQAASRRILLSGLHANTRFRTNVAIFTTPGAGSEDWAEVDVHVLDSFGRELRSIWVRLDADHPVRQIGSADLFAGLTTSDTEAASIVISNPRGTARVGAYATVIDNLSSDATFVAGQPVP